MLFQRQFCAKSGKVHPYLLEFSGFLQNVFVQLGKVGLSWQISMSQFLGLPYLQAFVLTKSESQQPGDEGLALHHDSIQ